MLSCRFSNYVVKFTYTRQGPSWSWSYGRWINNHICNKCL